MASNKMTLDVFADYYSLQAIISDRRAVEHPEIAGEARSLLARISAPIAACLSDYMYLICMGEARHAVGSSSLWSWEEIPKAEGRVGAYRFALKYNPLKTLPQLSELFNQPNWGGSYGGKKWKNITDIALAYRKGELSDAVYIDHVADLKHNGGTQFNKSEAGMVIPFEPSWSSDYYKLESFLTFKRDTLDYFASVDRSYFRSLSLPVGRLVIQYMQRIRIKPDNWLARPAIEYSPVQFGDAELTKRVEASVVKSSPPSSSSTSKKSVEKLDDSMYLSEDEMYDPKEIKETQHEPAQSGQPIDGEPALVSGVGDPIPAQPAESVVKEEVQKGEEDEPAKSNFADWLLHASAKLP